MTAILGMFWNVPQIELERLKTKKECPRRSLGCWIEENIMSMTKSQNCLSQLVEKDRPSWASWDL